MPAALENNERLVAAAYCESMAKRKAGKTHDGAGEPNTVPVHWQRQSSQPGYREAAQREDLALQAQLSQPLANGVGVGGPTAMGMGPGVPHGNYYMPATQMYYAPPPPNYYMAPAPGMAYYGGYPMGYMMDGSGGQGM